MASVDKIGDRGTCTNMSTPKVMERMLDLFETNKWHDCVFKLWDSDGTREELVFAHNLVLASSSPVFEALCFGPMAEENPIEIPDIDPVAFRMMLKFLYTDCIEFDSVEMACNVLYASKKYLIYSLVDLAVSYILYQINEENCIQVYTFGSSIQEEKLIKESWSYLCSHLDDVLKYISYESLSTDLVRNLVNEESLNGGEIILYKICLMWAEAECENCNLEKNSDNFRKVLVQADILNKIRWLTLSLGEFEEGPKKSGILTDEEIKFISEAIILLSDTPNGSLEPEKSEGTHIDDCGVAKLPNMNEPDIEVSQNVLQESSLFPYNISNRVEQRKKIQLKKYYCHRYIEQLQIRPVFSLQNALEIRTHIIANKLVRLTAIFLNAKTLPITHAHVWHVERDYIEKLFINICDTSDQTLFSTFFLKKVGFGTVFKIPLSSPVTLERSKEYKIQVGLLNSIENYVFGVRNSISKFPSGLCVIFKEEANIGENGKFVEANYLSFISGVELCL